MDLRLEEAPLAHCWRGFFRLGLVCGWGDWPVTTSFCRLEGIASFPIADAGDLLHHRMMAADLPPVSNCIEQVTELKSQSIIIEGKSDVISNWLDGPAVKYGPFEISLSQVNDKGYQTAILRFSAETPYRAIGGLIFSAQAAKMSVGAWTFQPPFCKENGMPH